MEIFSQEFEDIEVQEEKKEDPAASLSQTVNARSIKKEKKDPSTKQYIVKRNKMLLDELGIDVEKIKKK